MTVETETVNTNPQAAMGPPGDWAAPNRNDPNGSLRMKQSTETIRPKKERKRPARKAPSIHTGTTSSKADFFEAKVADAVGEANSSESDETFVYESNPPDPPSRPSRHHSRTPSTTSMASIGDPRIAMRSIGNVFDGQRGVAGKRSMKFTNNTYNVFDEDNDEEDRADMTPRGATMRSGVGSSAHHHIGRHGRTGAAGHGGIFEHESPFSAAKARGISSNPSRQSSRPNSPKLTNNQRSGNGQIQRNQSGQTSKLGEFSGYELEGEGADDERTPLMGTIRTNRSRAPRRSNNTNTRQIEHYQRQRRSRISQAAGCFILVVMAVLIVAGAVGFLLATTKQLYGVQVEEIKGVLASEQEIMLDLVIQAINPNVMTINVGDMDVNIFAKSKHVGSEKWWREHGQPPPASIGKISRRNRTRSSSIYRTSDNVDEGTDPIDSQDPQTMLLGRIYHFDSGLTFEGTPLKRYPQISIGEIRLAKPGNKTEAGGTERWERVLQYPFELIVRGILKYELPLSSHTITARIGASVIVHPEDVDRKGAMRVEKVAYEWDEEIADDEDGIEE
ncbi:hypothetical protein M501DRAFT_942783 [Patellaria atrata CBS 101060]|uniref:Phospholipid metabolism enzyme regulator n=1 Tax=Patellaria atrata CBS 101060 TaxID=1346257 RepID=A0A9P4VMW6_9PEZI|nr:hypothetical protein M501DRAFT_942783 [Patellaria atrata CBS 101060]